MRIAIAFIVFIVSKHVLIEQTIWGVKLKENLYFNWIRQQEGIYLKISQEKHIATVDAVEMMECIRIAEGSGHKQTSMAT